MTHHSQIDPWQTALLNYGGIEGLHLKAAKGTFYLDGEPIAVGEEGLKPVIIMPTAAHGAVLWQDQEIVGRTPLQLYDHAAPSSDIGKGWNPYTQFLCVGADATHRGQLMTFTSSSWSGRRAFSTLIGPYLRKAKREFPVVMLGAKKRRNDPNQNIDPTFTIVGWEPCDSFAGFSLPPPDNRAALPMRSEAPPTAADYDPDALGHSIDDVVTF